MNEMKKTSIAHRLRNAWRALRAKPTSALIVGIETRRCSECEYYKAAHEPVLEEPPARYYHEIEYQDKLVLVRFYEATDDGPREIARGHGYILHDGAAGIAQATNFALKKIWYKMQDKDA